MSLSVFRVHEAIMRTIWATDCWTIYVLQKKSVFSDVGTELYNLTYCELK
ncbi:hypothetical protein VSA01S_31190 [Vibrio sagamiensis NBRC 104589]|uniref:Uncharacterized protein n=1 Tax=Vibrio sagamiensis NBRC 104589 TaxID=1219064 RepID=A0A511QIK2_9VIBR|nr:hypothetical protein VSA01S_31190 [Vibrio sagamiensis NBRC 104589]